MERISPDVKQTVTASVLLLLFVVAPGWADNWPETYTYHSTFDQDYPVHCDNSFTRCINDEDCPTGGRCTAGSVS